MDKEKSYKLRTINEEIIPGTDINGIGIRRPDDRQPNETDEEYVAYLKWYYQKYFSNPQEFTASENNIPTENMQNETQKQNQSDEDNMFRYVFDLTPEKEDSKTTQNKVIIDTSFDEELDSIKSSNTKLNEKIRESVLWQKGKLFLQSAKTVAINLIKKANYYCMDITDAIELDEANTAHIR